MDAIEAHDLFRTKLQPFFGKARLAEIDQAVTEDYNKTNQTLGFYWSGDARNDPSALTDKDRQDLLTKLQ